MKAIIGAAITGAICFGIFVGLFALVGRFPDNLDKSFVFAVATPLLLIGSLIGGYISGVASRSAVAVVGTVGAVIASLAVAIVLFKPVAADDEARIYAFLAGMSIIPAALGHLIAVAFRPGVVRA